MTDTVTTPGASAEASAAAGAAPTPEQAAAAAAAATQEQGQQSEQQAPKPEIQIGKPDAPADEALAATQTGETFAYDATGNDMLDYALSFVGNLGFGPTHPAIKAAGNGDWSLLEVELARKGDKALGSDKIIALAQKAIESEQTAANEAAAKNRAEAVAVFGGTEEQFDGMMAWITDQADKGNVTPEERAHLNQGLAAGGMLGKLAIQAIMEVYKNAGGNVVTPAKTDTGSAAQTSGGDNQRWDTKSWSAYGREMRAKHGPNFERHPDYIRARQSAAAQAGIR